MSKPNDDKDAGALALQARKRERETAMSGTKGKGRDGGSLVSNGLMEVRLVVSLREARDLWCIHDEGDWEGWLRAGIVHTIETHLPRGIALRVVVDFAQAEGRESETIGP